MMSSFSVYSLNCSVCKGEFINKLDWLNHLVQNDHLRLARKEYLQKNWDSNNARECCLVIYMSNGLTQHNAGKVIQFFSRWETVVTDFVWWDDRPLVGTVQFESRRQALQVFNTISRVAKDGIVRIGNQKAHLRRAWKLHQLEWNAIFPKDSTNSPDDMGPSPAAELPVPVTTVSSNVAVEDLNEQLKLEAEASADGITIYPEHSSGPLEIPVLTHVPVAIVQTIVDFPVDQSEPGSAIVLADTLEIAVTAQPEVDKASHESHAPGNSSNPDDSRKRRPDSENELEAPIIKKSNLDNWITFTPSQLKTITLSDKWNIDQLPHPSLNCFPNNFSLNSLRSSFYYVRKSVKIREEDCEKCIQALASLKLLFLENHHLNQVVMFRHWYLKLKTFNLTNDLFVFLYTAKLPPDIAESFTCVPNTTIKEVFNEPEAKTKFSVSPNDEGQEEGWKVKYRENDIDININLMTNAKFMPEVQVCRLLAYLCTFDLRCYPLIVFTHCWAKLNCQSFSCFDDDVKFSSDSMSYLSLPEPYAMQWLVIFFMCNRKYIPTPREIQKRPHQILRDRLTNTDIGFKANRKFASKWVETNKHKYYHTKGKKNQEGEKFIFGVITLFLEFLKFCGLELARNGGYILNTRDGEVIATEFLEGGDWELTEEEMKVLLELQKEEGDFEKVNFEDWKLYLTHPYIIQWRFSVAKQEKMKITLKLMESTAVKLETFINLRNTAGPEKAYRKCGSLEEILLVND